MKEWRESTTNSPSKQHLGRYKYLFIPIDKSVEDNKQEKLRDFQNNIAECYVGMLNYAIQHKEYSYK